MELNQMVTLLASLVGFASLVSFLVQAGKYFGVVKDGDAQKVVAGLNLLALAFIFGAKVFFPEFDIVKFDGQIGQLTTMLTAVFGYVMMLFGSKFTYAQLKGIPFLGKSFTDEK